MASPISLHKQSQKCNLHLPSYIIERVRTFEYTYKWWRGNCKNSPLPTIRSAFQYVKVDLPFCIDICMCAYVLKWYSALFFLCWKRLIYLLLCTETTAQRYLWLNRRAVVKGIQIASPSFICILKVRTNYWNNYWFISVIGTDVRSYFNNWYGCTNVNGDNNNIRKLFLTSLRNIEVLQIRLNFNE